MAEQQFFYGGQAVIEGVMIRGRRTFSLAVRRLNGQIFTVSEPLSQLYTGRLRRVPLLRGIIVLIETLTLGIKALNRSANVAMEDQTEGQEEMPGWLMGVTLTVALALGVALFFIMPLFATRPLEDLISSDPLVNFIEGLIRMAVLVGYIGLIGRMRDIRRVFAYHGAEHMAVHTHEAGLPLEVANVRRFPTAHPRCGTAFLLTVMVVAIVVFAFVGRSPLWWLVLSRIVLIPVIAGISYEVIRFSGAHQGSPLTRFLTYPGLLLQSLTTRVPDDGQIEVAIHAMETALAADEGRLPALGTEEAEAPAEGELPLPETGPSPSIGGDGLSQGSGVP